MVETSEEIPRPAPGPRDAGAAIHAIIDRHSCEVFCDYQIASNSIDLIRASVAEHVLGRPRSC